MHIKLTAIDMQHSNGAGGLRQFGLPTCEVARPRYMHLLSRRLPCRPWHAALDPGRGLSGSGTLGRERGSSEAWVSRR